MKTGSINLGGIRYRVDLHEGMATFLELDRMSCVRITVQKSEAPGLLYIQASSATGFVAGCHITRALKACESFFGPNHWPSLQAKHRGERNIALYNIVRRPIFRPWQRLFWSHEVLFRIKSIGFVVKHQWRLWFLESSPRVVWHEAER